MHLWAITSQRTSGRPGGKILERSTQRHRKESDDLKMRRHFLLIQDIPTPFCVSLEKSSNFDQLSHGMELQRRDPGCSSLYLKLVAMLLFDTSY